MKKKTARKLLFLIGGVCILLWLALPDQGPLVLLDEFMGVIILLGISAAFTVGAVLIAKNKKDRKVYRLRDHWLYQFLVVGGCSVVLCILTIGCIFDLSMDVAQGPQTIILEDCSIRDSMRPKYRSFELRGTDPKGERITFDISRSDYYRLKDSHTSWRSDWSITVVAYVHTGRVIELR